MFFFKEEAKINQLQFGTAIQNTRKELLPIFQEKEPTDKEVSSQRELRQQLEQIMLSIFPISSSEQDSYLKICAQSQTRKFVLNISS